MALAFTTFNCITAERKKQEKSEMTKEKKEERRGASFFSFHLICDKDTTWRRQSQGRRP